MNKYNEYIALGACFLCIGCSQITFFSKSDFFIIPSALLNIFSIYFFLTAAAYQKYAKEYKRR